MYREIRSELEKIRRKYLDSAEEIVSGYNRECSLSKDYEGRQLFELLQNADDESEGSSGKVLISFDGKTLSVSNTGEPFSFRGVKSLLYPNASPKKIHANKIGCKGLGFRSILSWATCVTVASKDFTIQFSREYAADFLNSILDEKPDLLPEIKALSLDECPIATLTCPHILEESALMPGFSTSIVVECREELADTIESQITGLQFEELIFLPNLKEIEIICKGYHKTFYKIVEGNEVIIETCDKTTGEKDCAYWILFSKSGAVFDESGKNKDYEFIIAYDPSGEHQGEVLYSFFKTDVKLGFPALIHGTFDLTSDRNSLQKASYVNQQLIPLLADFMVQTAVSISESQSECNYNPLRLIISSDIDHILSSVFHFDELLKECAKGKKILPTIANTYISVADSPVYSDNHFADILHASSFRNLLQNTDDKDIVSYLTNDLNIDFYGYDEFCRLLNTSLSDYSIEEKAALAVLVNSEFRYTTSKSVFPHLLVDSNGNNIEDSSKVYPLPTEEQVIALPDWVDIKFLNSEMEKLLLKNMRTFVSRREFVSQMARYNLDEYSFDRLLRGIVNQVDEAITSKEKCTDILNWLWGYYDREDRQSIPDVRVKVICRDGEIRYAQECYIGSEYGNDLGERIIAKYSSNFIALTDLNLSCKDPVGIAGFMEWLGVAKYPRLIKKTLSNDEISAYKSVCYPLYVKRDDCWYGRNEFSNISSVTVGFFENLEIILNQSDFNDVLAWFLLDDRLKSRIYCDTEERNPSSGIWGWPSKKIDQRKVVAENVASYLLFYLRNTKWLPNQTGIREIPSQCCFEDNALDPFIIVPIIDYAYLKNVVGRNCKKDIDAILSRIGVADTFQEMDKTVIYNALLHLPELDTDCKIGKGLYRKIIREGISPEEYKKNNPAYAAFIANGHVLAKKGGEKKYVPVNEARYADKKVFSNEILKSFSMLDVDSRSGEDKVLRLFGVKPLKYIKVETNGSPDIHPLDEEFRKEYLRFIPFVYACRIGFKNANTDFRRLQSSKIVLCSRISIRYEFEKESHVSLLGDYETVYFRKDNIAYICVPQKYTSFDELKQVLEFADSVAELITVILDVNEDRNFFRDLFRESNIVREKKMRLDKGDENLEQLSEARRKFHEEINLRDEFWMTLADVLKLPDFKGDSADEIIALLGFSQDIDVAVNYNELSDPQNTEFIIAVFQSLGLDLPEYNSVAVHTVDVSKYWMIKLKEKMEAFKTRYQVYLYDDLRDNEQCVQLYDQCLEEYLFLEPAIENSISVDIDKVFSNEVGVTFDALSQYSETQISEIYEARRAEIDTDSWNKIVQLFSPSTIEAYLVFGRIDELTKAEETDHSETPTPEHPSVQNLVASAFSSPVTGFSAIKTEAKDDEQSRVPGGTGENHQKKTHSEASERKKQEDGIVGEAVVFKELLALYPDARWISGNAEKAKHIIKGDDTCGYDIKYTDENGNIQYVEVKASKNSDIVFSLSDNELRFACQNANFYEIIYVVIGNDGKPAHQPWRLGHLFAFDEGEDLLHNNRFSIESSNYCISAKPVEDR